ncbi:2-hydroxy-3-oxopropionate reductase [Alkalibacterium sp. AK22]|uniref:NAD(P)-dependent oxidoreductase n=1 Tax=Alkalibacterium sp. AK22 TaxID=1229520 RepID=UPI000447D898|nr:NAD(P)-dependent oxidoreductase [Alkalibacterium sp. AK22]EXJ22874.1 2-hydroxy-3-oxopropionate reductase [Alkalibacterium sp. AK22]
MKVGFIGAGVMGEAIIDHLMNAGHELTIYSRTKHKADWLLAKGAVWAESPASLADMCDCLFTMVGYPSEVADVYFGEKGIFDTDIRGKLCVDLTTSTPSLAQRIFKQAQSKGAEALDAPVSGGDIGARKGTLTVMVGGKRKAYQQVSSLLDVFALHHMLHGPAGSGQHVKMANQIMVAGTMTGLTEMLIYADKAGLDREKVIQTLSGGAAANWSLVNYGPRILAEDYSAGFFVKHFVKDLKIALDEAERMELSLPATEKASELYHLLMEKGYGEEGTQSLIHLWERGIGPEGL